MDDCSTGLGLRGAILQGSFMVCFVWSYVAFKVPLQLVRALRDVLSGENYREDHGTK